MAYPSFYYLLYQNISEFKGLNSSNDLIEKLILQKSNDLHFKFDDKSDNKSKILREKGNKLLEGKTSFEELKSIHLIYTQAIFTAESNIEKAYSYGNRSTVLFKMGLYNACVIDIDFAIEHDYPKTKLFKLLIRKAESFLMQEDFQKAQLNYSESLLRFDSEDKSCISWKNRINKGQRLCQGKLFEIDLPRLVSILPKYPNSSDVTVRNKHILSMSNKLYLKTNKEDGRGIFAESEIKIGEILAVESPYAHRLSVDCFLTHCYFCVHASLNLVPCSGCCLVGFCSPVCQEKGNSVFNHNLECGMMSEILSTKSKELGLLAYGTICQTSIDVIEAVVNLIRCPNTNIENEIVDSQSYKSAITIETNEHLRDFDDLFDRCVSSIFLAHCFLEMLTKRISLDRNNSLLTITQAFCRHLQGLPCNAHSLTETVVSIGGSLESSSIKYVANGLYPALSLINHSCSPNVVRITMNHGQCVLKAISPIKTEEQIFDNYSQHFATSAMDERQQQLRQQYYFNCCCVACKENWPTFANQLQIKGNPKLICCKCASLIDLSILVCPVCQFSIEEKYKQFVQFESCLSDKMELLLTGQFGDVENYLLDFSSLLYQIIKPPHILFNQTSEMLKMIWSMGGSTVSFF